MQQFHKKEKEKEKKKAHNQLSIGDKTKKITVQR